MTECQLVISTPRRHQIDAQILEETGWTPGLKLEKKIQWSQSFIPNINLCSHSTFVYCLLGVYHLTSDITRQ